MLFSCAQRISPHLCSYEKMYSRLEKFDPHPLVQGGEVEYIVWGGPEDEKIALFSKLMNSMFWGKIGY